MPTNTVIALDHLLAPHPTTLSFPTVSIQRILSPLPLATGNISLKLPADLLLAPAPSYDETRTFHYTCLLRARAPTKDYLARDEVSGLIEPGLSTALTDSFLLLVLLLG